VVLADSQALKQPTDQAILARGADFRASASRLVSMLRSHAAASVLRGNSSWFRTSVESLDAAA
jgi:hypothetical protein